MKHDAHALHVSHPCDFHLELTVNRSISPPKLFWSGVNRSYLRIFGGAVGSAGDGDDLVGVIFIFRSLCRCPFYICLGRRDDEGLRVFGQECARDVCQWARLDPVD